LALSALRALQMQLRHRPTPPRRQSVYQYGNPYTYSSNLPVYGEDPLAHLPPPGGSSYYSFNFSGNSAAAFMDGQYVTPSSVQTKYSAALLSSRGRVDASMMSMEPGSIVS
jgi:hypothetical protein